MSGKCSVVGRTCRAYATVASSKRPLRFGGPKVGLDHFIQRGRALALYREIVRATNKIPPSATRDELKQFARAEFERHRNVTEITHIRYLISTGKTEFDMMKRYIEEQAQ